MQTHFIIVTIFAILVFLAAFLELTQVLKLLERKRFRVVFQQSKLLKTLDELYNSYFNWRFWRKTFLTVLGGCVFITLTVFLYINYQLPAFVPAPEIVIDHKDTALLKRGEYLAEHVAICIDCHSPRDVNYFSWPIVKEKKGAGGPFLSKKLGYTIPGEFFTPNITPAHLGSWTDGEIFRLLTTGIAKNGKTINHAMPFEFFSKVDPGDIKAIIAYIRTLKAVNNPPAGKTEVLFLHELYNRTIPRIYEPILLSKLKTPADSGRYLVMMASCIECHTPKKWQEINDQSRLLSGGVEYPLPTGGFVHSANLTPDETGLKDWSQEVFVNRFKSFRDSGAIKKIAPNTLNSVMPWSTFTNMTDQDLRNIYAYLRTLKPVHNRVEKFTKVSLKVQ